MTHIEDALRVKLLSSSRVVALVGNRIFADDMPQGTTYPQICMWCLSDRPVISLSGESSKYAEPLYRFDCYAETRQAVKEMRAAVLACLLGFNGVITMPEGKDDVTVYGITFIEGAAIEFVDKIRVFGWEIALQVPYLEDLGDG